MRSGPTAAFSTRTRHSDDNSDTVPSALRQSVDRRWRSYDFVHRDGNRTFRARAGAWCLYATPMRTITIRMSTRPTVRYVQAFTLYRHQAVGCRPTGVESIAERRHIWLNLYAATPTIRCSSRIWTGLACSARQSVSVLSGTESDFVKKRRKTAAPVLSLDKTGAPRYNIATNGGSFAPSGRSSDRFYVEKKAALYNGCGWFISSCIRGYQRRSWRSTETEAVLRTATSRSPPSSSREEQPFFTVCRFDYSMRTISCQSTVLMGGFCVFTGEFCAYAKEKSLIN